MATFNGRDLNGLLGPLVIKKGKNGKSIVQTAPRQYKQTKNSVKSATMFGYGSQVAAVIRYQLDATVSDFHDSGMVNRFSFPVKKVLIHCFDKINKVFNFEQDSFARLADFEFNVKSQLINYLWVKPVMILVGNTLTITIPELKVPEQLTFPRGTNTCEFRITISQLNLNQAIRKSELQHSFEIDSKQAVHPAMEMVFELPNECLSVVALGLFFSTVDRNICTPFNTKAFSPANIIGAVITPGIYVEPIVILNPHKAEGKVWDYEHKLRF